MIPPGCVSACPACRYRDLPPAESNRRKHSWALSCLPSTIHPELRPIRAPQARWGYRRKALLHARRNENGWAFGMLRRKGWDAELVEIPHCPLHSPEQNHRLGVLRTLLPAEIPLAFVLASGDFLTLVLKCHPNEIWRAALLGMQAPLEAAGVGGLQVNWNPSAGRRVLSSRHQELLFGPALLHDGSAFYGPLSFRQQIPEMEGEAFGAAEAFLAEGSEAKIADLYCGTGTTLQRWEKLGRGAVGVELVGEACELAKRNAPGAQVLKGKVEDRLPQLDEFLAGEPFSLFTNPPREGHSREVNDWLIGRRPARIAYLSCNPRSLGRDLEPLLSHYSTVSAFPFDFFPQTDHVELLALLKLRA